MFVKEKGGTIVDENVYQRRQGRLKFSVTPQIWKTFVP